MRLYLLVLLGECWLCLLFGDILTRIALALVSTTLYGISLSCDSLIPSVSIRSNSRCFFSSSGIRGLFSEGERDLDLQKKNTGPRFKHISDRYRQGA
jgi:hypothetical protein